MSTGTFEPEDTPLYARTRNLTNLRFETLGAGLRLSSGMKGSLSDAIWSNVLDSVAENWHEIFFATSYLRIQWKYGFSDLGFLNHKARHPNPVTAAKMEKLTRDYHRFREEEKWHKSGLIFPVIDGKLVDGVLAQ